MGSNHHRPLSCFYCTHYVSKLEFKYFPSFSFICVSPDWTVNILFRWWRCKVWTKLLKQQFVTEHWSLVFIMQEQKVSSMSHLTLPHTRAELKTLQRVKVDPQWKLARCTGEGGPAVKSPARSLLPDSCQAWKQEKKKNCRQRVHLSVQIFEFFWAELRVCGGGGFQRAVSLLIFGDFNVIYSWASGAFLWPRGERLLWGKSHFCTLLFRVDVPPY